MLAIWCANMIKKIFQSFAARLSLHFMFILTTAVLLLSLSFLLLVRSLIRIGQSNVLKDSERQVFSVISELDSWGGLVYSQEDSAETYPSSIFVPGIPYYLSYLVYDFNSKDLLASNDPFLPLLEESGGRTLRYFQKNYFYDGDLNLLYYAEKHSLGEKTIVVVLGMNMDNNYPAMMIKKLPLTIIILVIPLLFLCFLVSYFITRKTISPVVKITKAAQSLTTEKLDGQLPLSGREDEIDELSHTFNQLFKRIKADFERERQFSSDVSHELNTPLTVISGQAGLLLRWGKDDPQQLEKSLLSIKSEAQSMHVIIDNLLQISRIESGRIKPTLSEVDLKVLFERIEDEISALSTQVLVESRVESFTINTDVEMLHQILMILVSNSIKFSEGKCKLTLSAFNQKEKTLIEVSDDGPGIDPQALPHIFERFFRADQAHTRSTGGSGLGLAIANTLASALSAEISVRNIQPHGACFTITL